VSGGQAILLSATARIARALVKGIPPAILLVALAFLVLVPLGMLVSASFLDSPPRPGAPPGQFTLENYAALVRPSSLGAARNSLVFALGATALALGIGSILAWLVARTDVPARRLIGVAGVMPLFMSSLVGALAYALVASPRSGYVNLALRDLGVPFRFNVYSPLGIIVVLGLFYAPYTFLFMSSALQLMNPELEEAARTHGASQRAVAVRIAFPLVKPALLGAGVLTLVLTLENFPVLQILGSPTGIDTMPAAIFRLMMQTPPRPTEAAAVGMLLLGTMVALVYAQSRILRERSYVTVTGKGFRPNLNRLGAWRWPGLMFGVGYLALAVVLPIFALFQSALRAHQFIPSAAALFDPTGWSLNSFADIFSDRPFLQAFWNSLLVGLLAAIGGTGFHFALSYYVNRTAMPLRSPIEYIVMLPVAVPALLIGMGFLWAWIWLPLPIYGTLWILALAYIARFLPQGFRSISATIGQVHPDLEDSARVAGASLVRAAWSILTPLILPGVTATMLLLFILSMRELSTSLFLFTTETRVLSIVIYEQWEAGQWSRVAAMSLAYSGLLLAITILGRRWLGLREL
jgi:iron(III) transport system permease protein